MPSVKILFACIPSDGHFNPKTQLVHLQNKGYDIRWYTGQANENRLKQMKIPYLPFKKTKEINAANLETLYPERKKLKGNRSSPSSIIFS